jgi:hypothetical protein
MQTKNCNSDKAVINWHLIYFFINFYFNLKNTLTHRNGSKKDKIETIWSLTNGQTFRQQFIFRATIVETKQSLF